VQYIFEIFQLTQKKIFLQPKILPFVHFNKYSIILLGVISTPDFETQS